MSAPVLSWLLTAQGKPRKAFLIRQFSPCANPLSTVRRQVASAQLKHMNKDPHTPTLRANPFPEVTDLFCRLPLPTLFYRPEAANLGDLLRILVRLGVRISLSFGLSRSEESAPDTSEDKVLYPPFNPISRQSDFRVRDG